MADELKKKSKHGLKVKNGPSHKLNESYDYHDRYIKSDGTFEGAKSMHDVISLLADKSKNIEIDARVLVARESKGKKGFVLQKKNLSKSEFLEAATRKTLVTSKGKRLKESKFLEGFGDGFGGGANSGLVGDDFVPLLGGPFNKQLYIYDYLRMNSLCFFAYNHDPIGKFVVEVVKNFAIGRGFRVDVTAGKDQDIGLAVWRAFEEVNDLQARIEFIAKGLGRDGEVMLWWLPKNQTKITYQLRPGQAPDKGLLPRVRLIDPSCIWDICTYPEDITRVLFYQWVAPTQYQIYTGKDGGQPVPSSKFIYQQIPAEEVMHYKVNVDENEKRGRSDLFPILGYLKRLRDAVQYALIGEQKNSAWAIDTTVKGDQADIDGYADAQAALGTIPPAGSEFIHTDSIERKYLANTGAKGGNSNAFDWNLSMIATGSEIPITYFGTHLSGAHVNKASALTSTEPFTKKIECRQSVLSRIVKDMFDRLMKDLGLDARCEVTFPELVVQDRSAKLADLSLSEMEGWISKRKAATMAAKEFGINDYDYEKEMEIMQEDKDEFGEDSPSPLTSPGMASITPTAAGNPAFGSGAPKQSKSAISSGDKANFKKQEG